MAVKLANLDLAPTGQLLARALPDAALIIHDGSARVLWRRDVDGVPAADHVALPAAGSGLREPAPRRLPLADGAVLIEQPLWHAGSGVLGCLLAVLPDATQTERAESLLENAALCIGQLAAQEGELADMATELGTRYEELNLLYTLDEVGTGYDPALGRLALQRMSTDVGDFLDVGLSGIYSPGESLDFCVAPDADDLRALWPELRARVLGFVAERDRGVVINEHDDRLRAALLGRLRVKLLAVPLRDLQGRVSGLLCLLNPLTGLDFRNSDRKLLEVLGEQASRTIQANYDPVTGLLNRDGFGLRTNELSIRPDPPAHALLYLNIDSFRLVNDSAGRGAGDSLLRRIAALLRDCEPRGGAVAHLGGDEFAVLFAAGESAEDVHRQAATLQGRLAAQGFVFDGKRFDLSVCIGIAHGGDDTPALLLAAEAACRVAKRYGRGQLRVYDPADDEYAAQHREAEWGPRISEALVSNQFVLFAQPIIALTEGNDASHHEVLLRLREPDGRIVAPGAFIPAAERYGLMPRVDRMVLKGTLDFLARAARRGCADDLALAVNVSGQSLADGDFLGFVIDTIEAARVPFERLCFEITETAAVADFELAVRFIESLRKRGSRVALDDFGSGLSSFGYLRRLPVDYLKIDGAIVRDMVTDRVNAAMVEAIHRIATEMHLRTIAEYVEDDAIARALAAIGVDYAQGYAFGRPSPIEQVLESAVAAPAPVAVASR